MDPCILLNCSVYSILFCCILICSYHFKYCWFQILWLAVYIHYKPVVSHYLFAVTFFLNLLIVEIRLDVNEFIIFSKNYRLIVLYTYYSKLLYGFNSTHFGLLWFFWLLLPTFLHCYKLSRCILWHFLFFPFGCAGQKGDYFYIIQQGLFDVVVGGRIVSALEEGKSFGELALLYNTPRAATVRAATACIVYSLDRDTFRNTLANSSFSKVASALQSLSSLLTSILHISL